MRGSFLTLFSAGLLLVACGDDASLSDDSDPDTDTEGTTTTTSTSTSTTTTSTTTDPSTSTTTTTDPSTSSSTTDPTDASSSSSGESSSSGSSSSSGGPMVAEIEVSFDGTPVASGGTFDIPETVDVDATGTPVVVTIENTGSVDLDISGVSVTGAASPHFASDTGALAATVGAGESTDFTVTFSPTNGGLKTVDVTITNTDDDEGTYVVGVGASTTPNTWRQLSPAASPGPRFNTAMTALDDNTLLLFGGRDPLAIGGSADDTWTFDPATGEWTELVIAAIGPAPRFAHGLANVGGGNVVMYGGVALVAKFGGAGAANDTWLFDVGTSTWTLATPLASPPGRQQHAMEGAPGVAAIFGGRLGTFGAAETDEFWVYTLAANTWTRLLVANGPSARVAAGMSFDGTDTLTLFGGVDNTPPPATIFEDTWNLSLAGMTITESASVTTPGIRFNAEVEYLSTGIAVTFGGKSATNILPLAATFGYDPVADAWTALSPAAEPPARSAYVMQSVGENKIILFGGTSAAAGPSGQLGDTWEYVGPRP